MKNNQKIFLIIVIYIVIQVTALFFIDKRLVEMFVNYGILFGIGFGVAYIILKKILGKKNNESENN